MNLSGVDHLLAALAALGAGFVNAVAGGGTLITFPSLVGLGVEAVPANMTNAVALCPGYFGGTVAARRDLHGQRRRLRRLALLAAVGGLAGSMLLEVSSDELFRGLVPVLILAACGLLAFQDRIRRRLAARSDDSGDGPPGPGASTAMLATCVYGGYFGAGMGIVTLATLGVLLPDTMRRTNALKQAITMVTNVVAALFFAGSGQVLWTMVAVMAPTALVGGAVGSLVARWVNARLLRTVVVVVGVGVAAAFWI